VEDSNGRETGMAHRDVQRIATLRNGARALGLC
jgi:hypothetical protein